MPRSTWADGGHHTGRLERIRRRYRKIFASAIALTLASSPAPAGSPGPDEEERLIEDGIRGTDAFVPDDAEVSDPASDWIPIPTPPPSSRPRPSVSPQRNPEPLPPLPAPDPAARLLDGSDATEYWTLYVELESGHRITQRFLLTNAGPGDHNAVAIGHLIEEGRKPYRYENGRRRARWTLSADRLFFDIAASHLDLHRPTGELRITKDDIEIRLFFDFPESGLAAPVPSDRLPSNYHVDVLAVAAATHGTIQAPWMSEPLATQGRTWLAHTWTPKEEAALLDRRVEIYAHENGTSFYGIQLHRRKNFDRGWILERSTGDTMIDSSINIPARWTETNLTTSIGQERAYPLPYGFVLSGGASWPRQITLGQEWLRYDPLAVLPQPIRWFIRRRSRPQEMWADAQIGGTLSRAPGTPSLPDSGETVSAIESPIESDSNSKRETEVETAERSVTGVASITFFNPANRR